MRTASVKTKTVAAVLAALTLSACGPDAGTPIPVRTTSVPPVRTETTVPTTATSAAISVPRATATTLPDWADGVLVQGAQVTGVTTMEAAGQECVLTDAEIRVLSDDEIRVIQAKVGTNPDGDWGPASKRARNAHCDVLPAGGGSECRTALLTDLGLNEDLRQISETDLGFPRALGGACSDVEFVSQVKVLSWAMFEKGASNVECRLTYVLYRDSPVGSRSEGLLEDAHQKCVGDLPPPTTISDAEWAGKAAFRQSLADHPVFGGDLETAETLGRVVCTSLDDGAEYAEAGFLISAIVPADAAMDLVVAAAADLCPHL